MRASVEVYVHSAELALLDGTDPGAPGGAVTVALCGSWDHEPPCRWPNYNALDFDEDSALFRTVFVAPPEDLDEVRTRIDSALRSDPRWRALHVGTGQLTEKERALGERLRATLEGGG